MCFPLEAVAGGNILKIKNLLGKMIMAMGETRWSPLFFCCDLMNSETHTHIHPVAHWRLPKCHDLTCREKQAANRSCFLNCLIYVGIQWLGVNSSGRKSFFVFCFYLCAGFRGKSQAGNDRKQLDLIDGWCKTCATPYSGDLPSVFVFWSAHSFISYHFSSQLRLILQRLEGV